MKFKKIIASATALTMSLALGLGAACDNGKNQGEDEKKEQPEVTAEKVIEQINSQNFASLDLTAGAAIDTSFKSYQSDSEGNKLSGAEELTESFKQTNSSTVKLNLADSSMDVVLSNKVIAGKESYNEYSYNFMREGCLFSYIEDDKTTFSQPVTDFSAGTMGYYGSFSDRLPEIIQQAMATYDDGLFAQSVKELLTAATYLADSFEGVSIAEGKLTIDINKTFYAAYNQVIQLIQSLTDETKVKDIIASKSVETLITALTLNVNVKELYDQLMAQLNVMVQADMIPQQVLDEVKKLPAPTETDSFYTYLVTLVNSSKLSSLVADITGVPALGLVAFGDLNVAKAIELIMQLTGDMGESNPDYASYAAVDGVPSIEQIKELVIGMINEYVTVTESSLVIKVNDGYSEISENTTTISNAKIELALDSQNGVTGFGATLNVKTESKQMDAYGYGPETIYSVDESVSQTAVTVSGTLGTEKLTLANIDGCKVIIDDFYLADGDYDSIIGTYIIINDDIFENNDVKIIFTVADEKITGIKVNLDKTINLEELESTYDEVSGELVFSINGKQVVYIVEIYYDYVEDALGKIMIEMTPVSVPEGDETEGFVFNYEEEIIYPDNVPFETTVGALISD